MDPKRVKLYNQINMCMCVDVLWIYMVANLILICSLKTYISFRNLETIAREKGLSYSSLLFFVLLFSYGHVSTHCFR